MKYAGAAAMYMVSKKLKKKYNITDARASLYDAANTWMEALDGRDFLGMIFFHKGREKGKNSLEGWKSTCIKFVTPHWY